MSNALTLFDACVLLSEYCYSICDSLAQNILKYVSSTDHCLDNKKQIFRGWYYWDYLQLTWSGHFYCKKNTYKNLGEKKYNSRLDQNNIHTQ